jgi:phosphate transport system permease protein
MNGPGRRAPAVDLVAGILLGLPALVVITACLWIVGDLLWRGVGIIDWAYLPTAPTASGRAGGIGPIIVSTLILVAICLAAILPVGLATALLLGESARDLAGSRPRLGALIRAVLDVLAGVPSIVYGLFGNAFFAKTLGMGYSLLAGGLTPACMALPLFVRVAEQAIRAVPDSQRQAAAALGLSRWTTCWRLLLPAALPGILAGLVLALGRALAETAALIFTSGAVSRMPDSVFDSGRSLSIHIYELAMNVPGAGDRAAAAAVVLVGLLVLIHLIIARWRPRS